MQVASIVLTGFMGTGKSSVGRLLAARLGLTFVDTDELIARRAGKSVAAIFADEGEEAFRAREAEVARELAGQPGLVIATGGGMLIDSANAAVLGAGHGVFCLRAGPAEIVRRLANDPDARPLLAGTEPTARVEELLARRQAAYARFTPIDTEGKSPAEVAADIVRCVNVGTPASSDVERLPVGFPGGSYEVRVGSGLLSEVAELVGGGPAVVISDAHVAPLFAARCGVTTVLTIPAGEAHKRLE